MFGDLNLPYAGVACALAFVCALMGRLVLDWVVRKYNRASLVVLIIALIIGLSAIAVGFEALQPVSDAVRGHPQPFQSLCAT